MPDLPEQEVHFSNEGAEIVIFESSKAVVEKTPRPASDVTRKMILAQLAKEAELRELMQQHKSNGSNTNDE